MTASIGRSCMCQFCWGVFDYVGGDICPSCLEAAKCSLCGCSVPPVSNPGPMMLCRECSLDSRMDLLKTKTSVCRVCGSRLPVLENSKTPSRCPKCRTIYCGAQAFDSKGRVLVDDSLVFRPGGVVPIPNSPPGHIQLHTLDLPLHRRTSFRMLSLRTFCVLDKSPPLSALSKNHWPLSDPSH